MCLVGRSVPLSRARSTATAPSDIAARQGRVSRKATKLSRYEIKHEYQKTERMRAVLRLLFGTYLCGAVSVQKGLAKPLRPVREQGERRQCVRATGRSEVAGQSYSTGRHVGPADARVSVPLTKRRMNLCDHLPNNLRRFRSWAVRVLGAFTSRKGFCRLTGEFPPGPCPAHPLRWPGTATPDYNTWWKCQGYARVGGSSPGAPPL